MNFNFDIAIVGIYLVMTLIIGFWKGASTKTIKDFAVSDQNYPTFVLVATIVATLIGGGSTTGVVEKIHSTGIIFALMNLGYIVQKLLIAYFVAPKIKFYKGCISCGDIIEKLYSTNGKIITGIISFTYCSAWIAVQIAAVGQLFYYYLNIDYGTGLLVSSAVIVLYSTFGGIRAVVLTDVFQFVILIIAFPVLCNIGLIKIGGYSNLVNQVPAEIFNFNDWSSILKYILPIFVLMSIPFNPSTAQRVLMSKDIKQVKSSMIISTLIEIPFFYLIGVIGLIAVVLYPEIESKLVMSHMINDLLPTGFKGLVIAGLLAVMMSSADSFLNSGAVAIVNDVFIQLTTKKSQRFELILVKVVTVLLGVFGIVLAYSSDSILDIASNFTGIWTSTILLPMFLGIIGIKLRVRDFYAVIIAGAVSYFSWKFGFEKSTGVNSMLIGLGVNSLLFFIFYFFRGENKIGNTSEGAVKKKTKQFNCKLKKIIDIFSIRGIVRFCSDRVNNYGSQYRSVGIIFILMYFLPMPTIEKHSIIDDNADILLVLKVISAFLSFALIVYDLWPKRLTIYLPVYWYFVLAFNLSFIPFSSLLLSNNSITSLISFAATLLILMLVVDWVMFGVLLLLGVGVSLIFLSTLNQYSFYNFQIGNMFYEFLNIYFFIILIGVFLLRNKEYVQMQVVQLLNEKVIKRTAHLTEALSVKKEFLNNISHEVRTPLQGILSISHELEDSWENLLESQRKSLLSKVVKNGDRLMNLVFNLLDMSKLDSKSMFFDMQEADLKEVVENVIDEFDNILNKYKINLEILSNSNTKLRLDTERISQVVRNLLSNAVKFGKNNDINIIVEETTYNLGVNQGLPGVKVSVIDSGIGVPKTELEYIFSPFAESSKTKCKSGGTGLGLSISKEIIDAHCGVIRAESNDNGSCFSFVLPQEKPTALKILSPGIAEVNKKYNVLLVDDEETCLTACSLILSSLGHRVTTASGGNEALSILSKINASSKHKVDLILLDLMMPDIYGINVLRKIKGDANTCGIPVIVQSGISDKSEIRRAYNHGAAGFIPKPYLKENLKNTLEEITSAQLKS